MVLFSGSIYPALSIVLVCILSTLFSEFLCYVLVYSDDSFSPLTDEVSECNKRITKLKDNKSSANEKKDKKELVRLQKQLKTASSKLNGLRFKTNFIMPFVMMAVFGILGSSYDGLVVGRLPFEPFSFIQGMTLRGIDGIAEDNRDCSFFPLYILGNMGLKPVITKLLGFAPPRAAGGGIAKAFEQAEKQQERWSQ